MKAGKCGGREREVQNFAERSEANPRQRRPLARIGGFFFFEHQDRVFEREGPTPNYLYEVD